MSDILPYCDVRQIDAAGSGATLAGCHTGDFQDVASIPEHVGPLYMCPSPVDNHPIHRGDFLVVDGGQRDMVSGGVAYLVCDGGQFSVTRTPLTNPPSLSPDWTVEGRVLGTVTRGVMSAS